MVSVVASEVLARVRDAVDAVLGMETWRCGAGDVVALVEGLAVESSRLSAARLRLLAEAQEQRVAGARGISTAGWFAGATRCRAREAAPTVALATALGGSLGPTGRALASGAVSVEHAGVIQRVMVKLADALKPSVADREGDPRLTALDRTRTEEEAQAFLLEHATRLDPDQLAVAGKHLLARIAGSRASEDAEAAHERALSQAGLTFVQLPDGTWFLRATLDAVSGATVAAALDAASPPRPAGPQGSRDLRTGPQRKAEALVQIADEHLGSCGGGSRTRPRVTVSVEARTVVDPWAHGAAPGELTVPGCGDRYGGHPLPPAVLSAMICDADVVPVLVGADRTPLDVGRTVYAFPEKIRAAIIARDGGCTFPHACSRPAGWCQVHHLVPFSAGGPTSERSGALVCTPAHLVVHRYGWSGRVEGDAVVWTPPSRAAGGGALSVKAPQELSFAPPWKPGLDKLVDRWRERLVLAPPLQDTG